LPTPDTVACGALGKLSFIGLIAFGDPPRADSRALLDELRVLGVPTIMVTGDAAATAATVARSVGLEGPVCPPGKIPDSVGPDDFAVYAGVFPEDKFRLVKAFQQRGHAVGMCGDGPTTLRPCARHRWVLRCRPRPMSPKRQRASS
jgi:H+-transporting ATPase